MKKITSIALSILLFLSLSACNSATSTNQDAKIKELEEQITSLQSELEEKPSSSSKQESSLSTASNEVEKSVAFTNKFETATTKCAQSGCVNYIASSGDTNCCISHSNKCIDCSCYIDGDASWCISCIKKALE